MRHIIFLVFTVSVTACIGGRPFEGTLPEGTHLDMTGEFSLSPEGELRFKLSKPCTMEYLPEGRPQSITIDCGQSRLNQIHLIAQTPWGQDIVGLWAGPAQVVFQPNWKIGGFDPLASDASFIAKRPWTISGL